MSAFIEFLRLFLTVLLVMDPIGAIPQFLAVTAHLDAQERRRVIGEATAVSGLVLLVFLLLGRPLLQFFGITPGAFYISGGLLFFLIAFEMIYSKPQARTRLRKKPAEAGEEGSDGAAGEEDLPVISVAVFPLAIPLIAGPGLLSVIIMSVGGEGPWLRAAALTAPALAASLAITYAVLRCSALLVKLLGRMGIFIIGKVMGLIMSGFAVQFIYNGLSALGIVPS